MVLAKRLRVWRIVEPTITRQLVITTGSQRPSTRPSRALTRLFKDKLEAQVREGLWSPPWEVAETRSPRTRNAAPARASGAHAK